MVEFFTFPLPSRIRQRRSYPIQVQADGVLENISFAFVETGCRHNKKRTQLKNKKELFLKYWGDTYKSRGRVDWVPNVYRVLSHYKFLDRYPRNVNKYSCDVIIHHKEISNDMLAGVDDEEKKYLRRLVRKRSDQNILEDLISRGDARGLHQMIAYVDENNLLGDLRGKIAEYFAQKTIESVMDSQEMVRYNNGHIDYFNKRFDAGAEVDQILQFYGPKPFNSFLNKLSRVDSVDVVYDIPGMNRYINKAV